MNMLPKSQNDCISLYIIQSTAISDMNENKNKSRREL